MNITAKPINQHFCAGCLLWGYRFNECRKPDTSIPIRQWYWATGDGEMDSSADKSLFSERRDIFRRCICG